MKLFSRKTLVALGTAAAISTSALSAPAFAQETSTTVTATVTETASPTEGLSSGSSDMDADEIKTWVQVLTAVIGVFSTILTFATNLDRFLK